MLPALQQSPTRDAAFFQLYPSPVVACGPLCRRPRARALSLRLAGQSWTFKKIFIEKSARVSAILVRFVYLLIHVNGQWSVSHTDIIIIFIGERKRANPCEQMGTFSHILDECSTLMASGSKPTGIWPRS